MADEIPDPKPTREETAANILRLGKLLNDLAFPEHGIVGRPNRPCEIERLKTEIEALQKRIEQAVYDPNQRLLRSALEVKGDQVVDLLAVRILSYVAWGATHLDRPSVPVARVCVAVAMGDMGAHLEARKMIRQMIIGEKGLRYKDSEYSSGGDLLPGLRLIKYISGEGRLMVVWSSQAIQEEQEEWRRQQEEAMKKASSAMRQAEPPSLLQRSAENTSLMTAKGIFDALKNEVIAIDGPLRRFSAQMSLHMRRLEQIRKGVRPNVGPIVTLLIGSSGSGKTHMAESFARVSGLPYSVADMSGVSQASYVGLSVDECFYGLLANKTKPSEAQKGILVMDEFDKLCAKGGGSHSSTDPQGRGIQAELLKPLEGCKLPLGSRRSNSPYMGVLDCWETNFLLCGAFDGLRDLLADGNRKATGLGFGSAGAKTARSDIRDALVKYGFMEQIVNRIGAIIVLPDPTPEQIVSITTHVGTGLLARWNSFANSFGMNLDVTDEAIQHLAQWACETRGYSRAVKTVLGTLVESHLFDEKPGDINVWLKDVKRAIEESEGTNDLKT